MSEDTTTNEWVISVDEIERLRAGKGNTTPVVSSKLSDSEKTALQTNGIVEITENQITNNYLKNNVEKLHIIYTFAWKTVQWIHLNLQMNGVKKIQFLFRKAGKLSLNLFFILEKKLCC